MTTTLQETTACINEVAASIGISEEQLIHYGKYKAKINIPEWDEEKIKQSKLILVTSLTPTKS